MRNYRRKHTRNPDKRMAAAVRLRARGLSLRQIAAELACSYMTVSRDLEQWEREHGNVVPLSQTPVTDSPRRGHFVTPECDSEPTNVVSLSERKMAL